MSGSRLLGRLGLLLLVVLVAILALFPDVSEALIQKSIRIPLYQRQYIQVKVGKPGRVLTLRLRWDKNQIFLYDSPYTYSNTFGDAGSDVFYLSPDIPPLRLPVVYAQEPSQLLSTYMPFYNGLRQDTSGGVAYSGVIGLGPASPVWTHWKNFTVSKYTLVLGAYDPLDTLADAPNITSKTGFGTLINALGVVNGTLALDFKPEEEFTYVPLRIFPQVYDLLFKKAEHRISNAIYPISSSDPAVQTPDTKRLVFWMSSTSSVIVTSFGGPEMALRIAEREGKDSSQITLGRIHMLEDFVYFQDKATGEEIIQEVYDTFPATEEGHASEGFLSLLALILWSWWSLETASMVYQWNVYGIFPRVRQLCNELRNANLSWIGRRRQLSTSPPATRSSKPQTLIGDSITNGGVDSPSSSHPYPTLGIGPVDWTSVSCLLFLTRLVCFWTFYTSIWGFKAARFAEHLAQLAYIDHLWGTACYYILLAMIIAVPLLVNTFFIRRYTHAGISLINMTLLICIWINRLPDTTSLFFSVWVNLLLSTLVTFRVFEWISWSCFRGSDSAISKTISDAKEFPTEVALANTEITTSGRAHQLIREVREMSAEAIERVREVESGGSGTYKRLPVYRSQKHIDDDDDNEEGDDTLASRAEIPDQALLRRIRDAPYSTGEVILVLLWTAILAPCVCLWLVTLNVLPFIETMFPVNPARIYLAVFYLIGFAMYFAWATVCRTFLQILQQGVVELREAFIELTTNLKAQHKNVSAN